MFNRFIVAMMTVVCAFPMGARTTVNLSGNDWKLFLDKEANWRNDRLYLPGDFASVSVLPYNPPTNGWSVLNQKGFAISVPSTLEEYLTTNVEPQPTDHAGVSWWVRSFATPVLKKGERAILRFGSVRHRAEVFVDTTLVGYDLIAETPFDIDVTDAVKSGGMHQLAVRITHPGGNYHWQDYITMGWGDYKLLPSRGFGGILAPVYLDIVPEVNIADIYMQNQPDPKQVKAIITIENFGKKNKAGDLSIRIFPKGKVNESVAVKKLELGQIQKGESVYEVTFDCPEVELWNLENPALYTCEVSLPKSNDCLTQDFGFRWFAAEGLGEDAILTLNGKRVMLRSAINWGYWPVTGLYPTKDMARRQVLAAKSLGLNMVNFHRSMSSSFALSAADEMGLLSYEEPGGFHSADHDPFTRKMAAEKLNRMVKRDRNHPSLVIYNLINEWGGTRAADTLLTMKRFNDMRAAHAIDPSRIMTFTSGWAGKKDVDEFAKANMQPFDTTLYLNGWFDNHRAGGPATWEQGYYRSPSDNFMFTDNVREIYMRGEEGALSTPPRIAKIHEEIQRTGKSGWDGLFWEHQYDVFYDYFNNKQLTPYFGDIDALTRTLGDIQLDHQGRRIQGMRMQNIGDVYTVNGWEAMPYDNHSGIVDDYRNVKGNVEAFARYTRPTYLAVCPRVQFANTNSNILYDVYAINETNVSGSYKLVLKTISPSGKAIEHSSEDVTIVGGNVFGQQLQNAAQLTLGSEEGMYRIEATLLDSKGVIIMDGYDEVLVLDDNYKNLDLGKGALYGSEDSPVRKYYREITGKNLPLYDEKQKNLDWVIISRSMLDEPQPIPETATASEGFSTTYFRYHDIADPATKVKENHINHTFVDGEQPHISLPANQPFSVIWNGDIIAPADGVFMLGVKTNQGVRFKVNGHIISDDWRNTKDVVTARPFELHKGERVNIEVQYRQTAPSGYIQLVWTLPGQSEVSPESLFARAEKDGTNIILLNNTDTWMQTVCNAVGANYKGFYSVGRNWVGGVHFVRDNKYFDKMPLNIGMGWPYQALVRDGDRRIGFEMDDENMYVGSYRSWPFHLGSAFGEYTLGKGKIIYNTLDIEDNLLRKDSDASVARRLFYNILRESTKK